MKHLLLEIDFGLSAKWLRTGQYRRYVGAIFYCNKTLTLHKSVLSTVGACTTLLLACLPAPQNAYGQQVEPCPLEWISDGGNGSQCAASTASSGDADYGPRIRNNSCPDVPTTQPDFVVNTETELTAALNSLDGVGGIIQIQDGTYSNWGSVSINSGGTAQNPIYIRSQTLYGAVFSGSVQFVFTSPHVVLSGISKTGATETHFNIQADNIRLACSDIVGTGSPYTGNIVYVPHGGADTYDDFELDNNKFRQMAGGTDAAFSVYRHIQCDSWSSSCGGVHRRHHIHHNYVQGVNSPKSIAFYWGLGWGPQDTSEPANDPMNYSDHLFENNHITGWSSYNPVDIKVSRMTLRYNCWENTRIPIIGRKGHDILYYGNWHNNSASNEGYIAGWGNYVVFNYYNMSRALFKIKDGQDDVRPQYNSNLWSYYSQSDGVLSNNVCDNCTHLVRTQILHPSPADFPLLTDPRHNPLAQNNLIRDNLIRSAAYVRDYNPAEDGHGYRSGSEFSEANTVSSNTVQAGAQKGNAACFSPGHASGLGSSVTGSSGLSRFDGSLNYATTIPAPSWWQ